MNEVFLIGKIITFINFDFIVNSKENKSLASFKIKTLDSQIIYLKAYNSLADFAYRKLKENDFIFIYGMLSDEWIIVKEIRRI